jgi:hypothetical protein
MKEDTKFTIYAIILILIVAFTGFLMLDKLQLQDTIYNQCILHS